MTGSPEGAAWSELLRALDALGRHITSDDFPGPPIDPDEGFRHVAQQALCWLGWAVGHGDATQPRFQRQNDLVTMWGGPNADNVYRHARVDPGCAYRIRGRMRSCDQFTLAIREGFRHTETPATLTELDARPTSGSVPATTSSCCSEVKDPNPTAYRCPRARSCARSASTTTTGDPKSPRPSPSNTSAATPCDPDRTSPPRPTRHSTSRNARSCSGTATCSTRAPSGRDNTFGDKIDVPRGLQLSQFGFCFYDLDPGDALHVHAEVPDARYWSLQLYTMAWFEPYDIGRVTSRNHTQMHVGDDGRFHLVVAHDDPGVPNWLDTEGRREGLLNFRYFWGSTLPGLEADVVPLAHVRDTLPAGTPVVDGAPRGGGPRPPRPPRLALPHLTPLFRLGVEKHRIGGLSDAKTRASVG